MRVAADSEFLVFRDGVEMVVKATDLLSGDDIRWDNRDLIFTLNEI